MGCLLLDMQATGSLHGHPQNCGTGFPVGHRSVLPSVMSFLHNIASPWPRTMRTVSCVNPLYVLGKEVLGGREAGGPHAQGPGGAGLSAPDPVCAPDHGSAPTSLPTLGIIRPTSLHEFPPNPLLSEMICRRLFFEGWGKLASKNLWTSFINQAK